MSVIFKGLNYGYVLFRIIPLLPKMFSRRILALSLKLLLRLLRWPLQRQNLSLALKNAITLLLIPSVTILSTSNPLLRMLNTPNLVVNGLKSLLSIVLHNARSGAPTTFFKIIWSLTHHIVLVQSYRMLTELLRNKVDRNQIVWIDKRRKRQRLLMDCSRCCCSCWRAALQRLVMRSQREWNRWLEILHVRLEILRSYSDELLGVIVLGLLLLLLDRLVWYRWLQINVRCVFWEWRVLIYQFLFFYGA